jgi:DivIVA domain-containing protein
VSSHGQRFRRRALRRGYKVDEVDAFLDRVEATLAGEQVGGPVGAQEVHDVVFRVRFGGYDEWQVDLHLDRVERQLAELEERGGRTEPRPAERTGSMSRNVAPPTERLQAPVRDERPMPPQAPPMPVRQAPARPAASAPAPDPYGRYDEPGYGQQPAAAQAGAYDAGGYDTGSYDAFEPGRHGKMDMTAEIRMPEREQRGGMQPPERDGYGQPGYGPPAGNAYPGGYGGQPGYGGDRPGNGYGPAPMSGPPMPSSPMPGSPMPSSPMSGSPMPSSPMSGPPMGGPGGDLHRVDQLRRTFQPRRFGSGYDPAQVDGLFQQILEAMSGRGPLPVNENELDTLQFGLVPNGYFEAEVDAALREVKDILRRR